jgi:hypothetical protein
MERGGGKKRQGSRNKRRWSVISVGNNRTLTIKMVICNR